MYVVLVLMMNMLTRNNNMRTRHVQFLKFVTVTPLFIQPDREISSRPNLSRVYYLLDQKPCVALIELNASVSHIYSCGILYILPLREHITKHFELWSSIRTYFLVSLHENLGTSFSCLSSRI